MPVGIAVDVPVETFGMWLRGQVWSRGLSNKDLLKLINADRPADSPISKAAISQWMNDVQPPRALYCLMIAKALDLDPNEVLVRAGRPPMGSEEAGQERARLLEVNATTAAQKAELDEEEKRLAELLAEVAELEQKIQAKRQN